ncbi:unnamed protein product [Zymoseptoria tritici ST99CH_1A5]|uniref:Uncharacterized protein n=1 Tax=Zymoseptoria tritici ST99CH_1A5 TaxID=1276529 RepID=A0A1Y6LST7_ZYMTR|nr:unnamed protein product [Zymoseptoria tritici ST99CH_1A5]
MADRRDESSADPSTPDSRDISQQAQQSEAVGRVDPSQQASRRRTNMAGGDSIFVTPGPEDLNLGSFNPRGMAGAARMQSDEADFAQRLEGQLLLPQPLLAPTRPPQGQVNMQQARQAPFQAHISPHPQRPAATEHTPHLTPGHGRPVQMQAAPAQAARRRQTHRQTRRGSAPSQQAPDQEPIVIPDDGDPPLVTFRFNGAVATMPKTRVTRFVKGEGSKVF